MAKVERICL